MRRQKVLVVFCVIFFLGILLLRPSENVLGNLGDSLKSVSSEPLARDCPQQRDEGDEDRRRTERTMSQFRRLERQSAGANLLNIDVHSLANSQAMDTFYNVISTPVQVEKHNKVFFEGAPLVNGIYWTFWKTEKLIFWNFEKLKKLDCIGHIFEITKRNYSNHSYCKTIVTISIILTYV